MSPAKLGTQYYMGYINYAAIRLNIKLQCMKVMTDRMALND